MFAEDEIGFLKPLYHAFQQPHTIPNSPFSDSEKGAGG